MIIYKSNMAGPYHIESGLPCQDSFAIYQGEGYSVLAVTDGLGSELHSDIGASVAAQTAVEYCSRHISSEMQFDDIKKVMNNALVNAYKAVLTRANEDGNDSDEYDCTLCLAVYDGEHLSFAQSGDSGLVALLENGEYRRVTTQQRDEEGRVFPLCWGPEKWEFGQVDSTVSAFMLMTDGVFEQICPKLMRKRNIEINIPLAQRFLDRFDCTEDDVPSLEKAVYEYLDHYPKHLLGDDKTVVVLINPERKPEEKDEAYYAIPDWKAMREEAEKKLFENCADSQEKACTCENKLSSDAETACSTSGISQDAIQCDSDDRAREHKNVSESNTNISSETATVEGPVEHVKKNEQLNILQKSD